MLLDKPPKMGDFSKNKKRSNGLHLTTSRSGTTEGRNLAYLLSFQQRVWNLSKTEEQLVTDDYMAKKSAKNFAIQAWMYFGSKMGGRRSLCKIMKS